MQVRNKSLIHRRSLKEYRQKYKTWMGNKTRKTCKETATTNKSDKEEKEGYEKTKHKNNQVSQYDSKRSIKILANEKRVKIFQDWVKQYKQNAFRKNEKIRVSGECTRTHQQSDRKEA